MNCYGIIIVHNRLIARAPVIARDLNHIRRGNRVLGHTTRRTTPSKERAPKEILQKLFPGTCGESERKVPPTLPISGRALGMTNTVGMGAFAP